MKAACFFAEQLFSGNTFDDKHKTKITAREKRFFLITNNTGRHPRMIIPERIGFGKRKPPP